MFETASADSAAPDLLVELASTMERIQRVADIAAARPALPASCHVRQALSQAADLLALAYAKADLSPQDHHPLAKGGLAGWQVRTLRRHVADHLDQRITIDSMARIVRISGSYLCRTFQVTFGCSPMEYLRDQRIEAAKSRLRSTNGTLSQIACACGFADQPHFTRTFRAQVGLTPRAWRMAWLERAARDAQAMPH